TLDAAYRQLYQYRDALNNPPLSVVCDIRTTIIRSHFPDCWLNPPEWLDPIAARIDAADDFADVPADARPLIRQSAIMAAAAKDPRLKKRTLTALYNERPAWLRLSHESVDRAVLAAYAAIDPQGKWEEDWAQVWVETGAGTPLAAGHALAERRK